MAGKKILLGLGLILLLACALTLAYAFGFRIEPVVDAHWYDTIGWNLAQGKGFRLDPNVPLAEDWAIAVVGPAYSYFLAGIYAVFGHHIETVWILQSLLHALNALLVFLLARKTLPEAPERPWYALFAAALYGFNPDLIQIAAMLFSETLYLTVILVCAIGMASFLERPTLSTALGTSALLGFAILVRPVALVPFVLLLVLLALKKHWKWIPAAIAVAAVLIGLWTARNYSVYGRVVLLTAAGGYDLWVGNNPDSAGEQLVAPAINDYKETHGVLETDRHGAEEYVRYLVSDPADFLRLQAVKAAKFFSALRTSAWWFHLSGIARLLTFVVSAPFFVFYIVAGGAGLISAFRHGPAAARIAALLTLAVPAVVIPITVTSRLRYPMYPFLAVLCALAVFRFRRGEIPRRWFGFSLALIAVATAVDVLISAPQIPARILGLFS
jgi:hypothetical protein